MLDDIFFKLGRKALPSSVYSGISKSVFGRDRSWKRIDTYASTFSFYKEKMGEVSGKTIVEVGSGDQYYTALYFLNAGAHRVLLVDPKSEWNPKKAESEIAEFNRFNQARISYAEVENRILCFRDLTHVPGAFDATIDAMCSFLVLEHFSDLPCFFKESKRLLKQGGSSYNLVDLTDHTYHVFAKYGFTRGILRRRHLYHLRYSDRLFSWLNDSKCYMNRRLLPEYLRLTAENGLTIKSLHKEVEPKARLHSDLVDRHPGSELLDLKAVNFYLELGKHD
jgi:SAM-dependent methyltransferase